MSSGDGGGVHPKIAQAFSMVIVGGIFLLLGLLIVDGGPGVAFAIAGVGLCAAAFVVYGQGHRETNASSED